MFTRKTSVTFSISVAFWLAATWYYAWYCEVTGRTHLAEIGLQVAGLVAVLGFYALRGISLQRNAIPGTSQIGVSILAAAAACALFSFLFYI